MQSFAHFTPTPQKIVAQKPKTISSKEEFEVIKTHCMQGANMLRRLENFEDEPLLQTAYDIARWHHERWDGSGFPDGLKGDSIPIAAQVVALADAYDSLVGKGDKHLALPQAQAIAEQMGFEADTLLALGREADYAAFSGGDVTQEHAERYWHDIAEERKFMLSSLPTFRRWRAKLSLADVFHFRKIRLRKIGVKGRDS